MRRGDMTEGVIWKQIILFAIPLLLSNLLQQLYTTFDAVIVGNYVGKEALAAVGSTGHLINMTIAFFSGMSLGASVLISQYYGARDPAGLHNTVHTSIVLALLFGIVLSVVGYFASPILLRWMNTPEEILPLAAEYLRVYFLGLVGLTLYNMGTAILRAVGDSRRPLYFLLVSTVIHIALDLIFVNVFHWGVSGVAWSTVLSQAISAALVMLVLCRSQTEYKVYLRSLRLKADVLRKIARIGLPAGIQQSVVSLSNIVVQTYINGLGADAVSGYSAGTRIDSFTMLPAMALGMGITTFVGQNIGARKVERAREGTKQSIVIALAITVCISVFVLIFAKSLLRLFSPDPVVIDYGYQFMRVFVPTYFILCITQVLPGALRGAGDVKFATATSITCFVVLRQIYLFIITKVNYTVFAVALCYPITWFAAAAALIFYYRRANRRWDVLPS